MQVKNYFAIYPQICHRFSATLCAKMPIFEDLVNIYLPWDVEQRQDVALFRIIGSAVDFLQPEQTRCVHKMLPQLHIISDLRSILELGWIFLRRQDSSLHRNLKRPPGDVRENVRLIAPKTHLFCSYLLHSVWDAAKSGTLPPFSPRTIALWTTSIAPQIALATLIDPARRRNSQNP